MPHADEGQIHAYLDRQGEFADPVKRRELGKHIADCSRCTRALKDARRLRNDAEELLKTTRLREVQAPPFAEIAARAESRSQTATATRSPAARVSAPTGTTPAASKRSPRTFKVWRSLAWAATVVLAVGIGWSVRPLLVQPPASNAPAMELADASPSDDRAAADEPAAAAASEDRAFARRAEAEAPPVAAPDPPLPAERDELVVTGQGRADTGAPGRSLDSQRIATLAEAASAQRGELQSIAVRADTISRANAAEELRARSVAREQFVADSFRADSNRAAAAMERARRVSPDTSIRAARDGAPAPARAPLPIALSFDSDPSRLPVNWNVITREEAERVLGGPVVWVPDLEIVGLGRTDTPNGVRLLQAAGSGALLELEIRAIVPASAGNRGATRPTRIRVMEGDAAMSSTGTATIGRYLITAKAGFPTATLQRLLEQLTYAPASDQLRDN